MKNLAELFHFNRQGECEGLLGRSGLAKIAQREMDRAEREGGPLAVMLVEIDHFDRLTAALGAAVADSLMDAVGSALVSMCGAASAVARLRSQEFAVLQAGQSTQELSELAERLRAEALEVIVNKDGSAVTVSVGIGMFYSGETDWTHMLGRADVALSCAKNNGFNRVVMDSGSASAYCRTPCQNAAGHCVATEGPRRIEGKKLEVLFERSIQKPMRCAEACLCGFAGQREFLHHDGGLHVVAGVGQQLRPQWRGRSR